MKKSIGNKQTAQQWINIEDIKDDILISKDGYIFGYIYVKALNSKLMSDDEKLRHCENITSSLEIEKNIWQLISIPRTVDINGMLDNLIDLRKKTNNDARLRLIGGEITSITEMERMGVREPLIFIKIWEKASKTAISQLKKRLSALDVALKNNNIKSEILKDKEIVYICKCFTDLTAHNKEEVEEEKIPVLSSRKRIKNNLEDNSLLNLITPIGGIKFGTNKIIVGNVTGRIYGAVKYPSEVRVEWLIDIMNFTNAITSITFTPSGGELAQALSKTIKSNIVDADMSSDPREKKRLLKKANDAENLIEDIDEKNSMIGFASILVMPFSENEETFEEVCREINRIFISKRIKIKILGSVQEEAFKALSPYFINQTIIDDITNHIMPLETIIGGSPMSINTFKDDNGNYFGKTDDGGIVSINMSIRAGDRTNSNIILFGKPGSGKSTVLKHIIQTELMKGIKIIAIDPENELTELCENLGGKVIIGSGGKNKVNPLQIRVPPMDDDEEKIKMYEDIQSPLAMHLRTLEVFFDLYLENLSAINKALLQKILVELYTAFNITWDTDVSSFANTDFPIFSDLYKLLVSKGEEYKELEALLYDISNGADAFIWNGYTNIDLNSNFISFNTSGLINSSDKIKRTQYFNLLLLCWEKMSTDKKTEVRLVCDEAYLLMDPNTPQTIMFLRNIANRCRKYEGGLIIAIQSIISVLDEKIRGYSQSLIDNPSYKILFGADGKNLKEMSEIFELTAEQQNILLASIRGTALCLIGNRRLKVNFELPKYKLDLMGKGGGR